MVKRHLVIKSKKQARLFGIIAGGGKPRTNIKVSPTEAKRKLKGLKIKRLPMRVK